eukprot:COSAG06_NODE_8453_length_2170_cov_2.412844_1_plen_28_part_10
MSCHICVDYRTYNTPAPLPLLLLLLPLL